MFKKLAGYFVTPRKDANGYPFDLDASERWTRPHTGIDFYPYPYLIGCLSGFMPQYNRTNPSIGYAKSPFGPNITQLPVNLQWQITVPGLSKGAQ